MGVVIALGWWLKVKSPKVFAYFSERYGYEPPRWRVLGWRIWLRRMRPLTDSED